MLRRFYRVVRAVHTEGVFLMSIYPPVVGLLNEKGGVGKTTVAYHLAAGLAHHGRRVLLIDADAQACATEGMGVEPDKRRGFFCVVAQDAEWSDHIVSIKPDVWSDGQPCGKLLLCPGSVATQAIPTLVQEPKLLTDRINDLRESVDVVVIDTSPTPSMLNVLIWSAMTHVLIPTEMEIPSLRSVANTMQRIDEVNGLRERVSIGMPPIQLMGIQPNKVHPRTNAHSYGLKVTLSEYKRHVWPSLPVRTVWRDASWHSKSLFAYAPDDVATMEAWSMVDRVMRRLEVAA